MCKALANRKAIYYKYGFWISSRSHRTPNKPHYVKGQFTEDGIEWERHDLAKSINKNKRAYPMTLSFEQQRNLVGPCAGTKIREDIAAHNQLRAETMSICGFCYSLSNVNLTKLQIVGMW
ncbi:hypothetical protein V8D89_016304 [Ganoderma adspersum]